MMSYTLLRNTTTTLATCDIISKKRTQPTAETLRWINSNVTGQEKDGNMRPPPKGKRERGDKAKVQGSNALIYTFILYNT